jgi:hypothetical protein
MDGRMVINSVASEEKEREGGGAGRGGQGRK